MTRFFLLIALALVLAACSPLDREPVRIGINPWPGYEFLYLAQEVGIYKQLGLNVKLIEYGALEDVVQGFKRGNVDVTATTLAEVAHIYKSGDIDMRAWLYPDYSNGSDMVIARRDFPDIASLNGKRIGIEPGTISQVLLQLAVRTNADPATWHAQLIEDTQDNLVRRMEAGELDAVTTYPPFALQLQRVPGMHRIFDSSMVAGKVIDVVASRADFLERRRNDIELLKQAWELALDYFEQHREQALQIMAARERISPQELADALQGMRVMRLAEQRQLFATGAVREALDTTLRVVYENTTVDSAALACCLNAP